jgi:histidyl-tRNA synthetase
MNKVTPKPISGFPELLPDQQIVFNRCIEIVRRAYERFGFAPIETPAVERKEVLTSKGAEEKEIYALSRLVVEDGESPDTDLALHFDLTVPLARYVAMNAGKLTFPFRRYQIQKVWRGERPQAGRYRELYQCDIDAIGRGSLSLWNDAEIPSVIYNIFREMQIGDFQIRINNRRLLQGYFEYLEVSADKIGEVLRSVDRIEKIGADKVRAELSDKLQLNAHQVDNIMSLIASKANTDDTLTQLRVLPALANARFAQGVQELETVVNGVRSLGVPDTAFRIDLSIARGLGYYTGTVYETQLLAHPELGSICSGGRYDDLASYFTNEKLPGVGISIGLSRLVIKLLELGILKSGASTPARVLVTVIDAARMSDYLRIASLLRENGIATEVFLETKGLGDQLKYANKKGFAYAVIAGENEFSQNQVKLKNLMTGDEQVCALAVLAGGIK